MLPLRELEHIFCQASNFLRKQVINCAALRAVHAQVLNERTSGTRTAARPFKAYRIKNAQHVSIQPADAEPCY